MTWRYRRSKKLDHVVDHMFLPRRQCLTSEITRDTTFKNAIPSAEYLQINHRPVQPISERGSVNASFVISRHCKEQKRNIFSSLEKGRNRNRLKSMTLKSRSMKC